MCIKGNILKVLRELPHSVRLVAVSKTHPVESIQEAYEVGQRLFGENRPQEMKTKWELLPKDVEWHMIGHLQTNKVRMIMPFVRMIHSVDSERLLELIDKEAERANRSVDVLLEVFVAQEQSKHGWEIDQLREYVGSQRWCNLKSVRICGLMCVATYTDDMSVVKGEFRTIKELFDQLQPLLGDQFSELSMGMSHDRQTAIECGSTMVRVGSDIFGNRDYK